METPIPLWQPSPDRTEKSNLNCFLSFVAERCDAKVADYEALYNWSVAQPEAFWTAIWDYGDVIAETRGERVLVDGDKMPGAQFFPDAKLNFAENLLRRRDDGDAIVFWGEDKVKRRMSWRALYELVSRLRQVLALEGVGPGDRVAGFVPNMPETTAAMLATVSLGGVWCSCSPDFGVQGVLDRFGQIEPKVLFAAEGYFYNGKSHDSLERMRAVLPQLPTVQKLIVFPYTRETVSLEGLSNAVMLPDAVRPFEAGEIDFVRLPFNHPLYIMFSSGTTGKPKCIVHGAGGTLLQHLKEHLLHCDIKPDDRVFYFTTCGWMMWNWLQTVLAAKATMLLYDGSPFYPDGNIIFDLAQAERMTFLGTSAKFIDACHKQGVKPRQTHDLTPLRAIASTGSPLVPESYDYVYEQVKPDLQLASISGGTDILSCFVLGCPVLPVYRGEIQTRGLGMAVDVFDDQGNSVRAEKGELVCTKPFPSMPIYFWNDPDGERYFNAYFARFPNIWCHGDFAELTPRGGMIIYGRSDAVLNPGGVRIGTAEIYRQVEQLDEVVESIVIGQEWDGDVRVVLFVKLRPGLTLDEALTKKIKTQIRQNTTPRHTPAKVVQVDDIPRTKSGKIVELAVRDTVHGRDIKNLEALANPDALKHFKGRSELTT